MAPPNWERYVRAATAGVAVVGAAYTLYNYVMAPTIALMCEEDLPEVKGNHSKILRYQSGCRWKGINTEEYKADGTAEFKNILRTELVGKNGESCQFHVRYFEVGPGGYSTLEKHVHEHVVIPIRGRGVCTMSGTERQIGYGDVIYIAPSEPHQLQCPAQAQEPLGFLCIVNADRDRPVPLRKLADGTFEEIVGAVSACEFKPKHLRKPGDLGYAAPK
mmetsp:Transcript_12880/g.24494  ORF Transcript_12880/g.24494 Transcript_12880/m.24494 type:complete len:218 (+) Transcript_12880:122-775(+)|eukprot:CAMPEP_0114234386 /NCGR_PEP_ID=MMETSP0058-20121206/5683_1 /TAXON_ID=36894 /ORGANISM="Pyramimonas parkeae, CCMP726" /LENGTH=217 /DNA_ID=CAMNT_0001346065 /DNA_START=106 /DNA_END=759 /DNA_ORIENTATION=+